MLCSDQAKPQQAQQCCRHQNTHWPGNIVNNGFPDADKIVRWKYIQAAGKREPGTPKHPRNQHDQNQIDKKKYLSFHIVYWQLAFQLFVIFCSSLS